MRGKMKITLFVVLAAGNVYAAQLGQLGRSVSVFQKSPLMQGNVQHDYNAQISNWLLRTQSGMPKGSLKILILTTRKNPKGTAETNHHGRTNRRKNVRLNMYLNHHF